MTASRQKWTLLSQYNSLIIWRTETRRLASSHILGSRHLQPLRTTYAPSLWPNDVSRAGGTLLGVGQWKGEKEGRFFSGARYMNVATQAAGQLADDRKPSPAPNEFRHRPIVRDHALHNFTCKHQLNSQFRRSTLELRVSCHISQQLGYNQPKLPAPFAFKPQIIRRKNDTYREAVQSVFCNGEAKLLEVPRGFREAPMIWDMQRPMNIGASMQQVDDVEQRGLDRHTIGLHGSGRNRAYGGSKLVSHSVIQLAKKQ